MRSQGTRTHRLEHGLTPTDAVLRWLAEAQPYGSLAEYAGDILREDPRARPFRAIADQVAEGVRRRLRVTRTDALAPAIRAAYEDALVLYQLVLHINTEAEELTRVESLRVLWLRCEVRELMARTFSPPEPACAGESEEDDAQMWRIVRTGVQALADGVQVEQAARAALSHRYFRDREVLLADVLAEWRALVDAAESLDRLAKAAGPKVRRERSTRFGSDVRRARVDARVRDLLDGARAASFEALGDRRAAAELDERRWREQA